MLESSTIRYYLTILLVLAVTPVGYSDTSREEHQDCSVRKPFPLVLTPSGKEIPSNGGILIGWEWPGASSATGSSEIRFDQERGVAPPFKVLAPGLAIFRPRKKNYGSHALSVGSVTIGDFVFDRKESTTDLPTPVLKSVHKLMTQGVRHRSRFVTVEAVVEELPPDAAVGVILWKNDKNASVPISFQRLIFSNKASILVYSDPEPCAENPVGVESPSLGGRVSISWVGWDGTVSRPSTIAVVTE